MVSLRSNPRGAGPGARLSLWQSELCLHPAIWVVSIKRGSTRAFSPVPAGRGIRPVWIGATCAHWIPATITQSETICRQGNRLVPLWRPGHE